MIAMLDMIKTLSGKELREIVGCPFTYKNEKGIKGVILDTRPFDVKEWPDLRIISRVGVGLDNIDLEECKKRGIKVYTTPCQELTNAVAEFTIFLMLSLLRRNPKGRNLSDMVVGIFGVGRIGSKVRRILQLGFGTPIVKVYDPIFKMTEEHRKDLLRMSDIVTIHASGNKQIIGKDELDMMKEGSYLINTARKGCVDEDVVVLALREGKLAGFASDVNGSLLGREHSYTWQMGHTGHDVITTPHIASETLEARTTMERLAMENLKNGLKAETKE